jgi:hypothetical protein
MSNILPSGASVVSTDNTNLVVDRAGNVIGFAGVGSVQILPTFATDPLTGKATGLTNTDGSTLYLNQTQQKSYLKFVYPLNQVGNSTNLPTDYSGNLAAASYAVNVSTPWANAGYLTVSAGSNQHTSIAQSAFNPDMFTDSWEVSFTMNKAAPAAAEEAFMGNGASSTNRGFYASVTFTTNKLAVYVNTNTGFQTAIAASTATVGDGTDHHIRIACDAVAKKIYLYIDGVLDTTSAAFTSTASTNPIGGLVIGRAGPAGNAVALKLYGLLAAVYPASGLPINSDDLAKALNTDRRAPGLTKAINAFF